MALKLFVHDTTTGSCELAGLVPYPTVTSADPSVTILPVVDTATGQVDYQIDVEHTVDINVENFTYDAATKDIILTETDGDTHTINVSDLLDNVTSKLTKIVSGNVIASHDDGEGNVTEIHETITSFSAVDGTLVYVDEAGGNSEVAICELLSTLPDNGTTVGG